MIVTRTITRDRFGPGTRLGDYVVERELRREGTGMVYLAKHVVLPRQSAVKVMHGDQGYLKQMAVHMLREACLVEALSHPGIPRVYECGVLSDRRPWTAFEYVDGEALDASIGEVPLPVADVVVMMRDVADILDYLHTRGIVHRNVTPATILRAPGRRFAVTLVGWGEACTLDTEESEVDARDDVHELGRIAFRALTGATATTGGSSSDWYPGAPLDVANLIDQMMAARSRQRPTSAEVRDSGEVAGRHPRARPARAPAVDPAAHRHREHRRRRRGGRLGVLDPHRRSHTHALRLARMERVDEHEERHRGRARPRVLIIDDEVTITNALRRFLAHEHDVTVYNDPLAALVLIRDGVAFDVILCDLMMPRMNGVQLHLELARIAPGQAASTILMTGGSLPREAIEHLARGNVPNLAKPFDSRRAAEPDRARSPRRVRSAGPGRPSTGSAVPAVRPSGHAGLREARWLQRRRPMTGVTTDCFAPGTRLGDYRIDGDLPGGWNVEAYEATHVLLPRRARLIVLHAAFVDQRPAAVQMMREACLVEAMHHPGVPRVFECGVVDRRPWIACELIEGTPLSVAIVERPLPVVEVLELLRDAAQVLDHAHRRGVVHRNLRPEVLIRTAGRAFPICITGWCDARIHDADRLPSAGDMRAPTCSRSARSRSPR